MATPGTKPRAFPLRPLFLAGAVAAAGAVAGGYLFRREPAPAVVPRMAVEPVAASTGSPPPAAVERPVPSVAASISAPAAAPALPNFDVVRVGPQGNAVIAGRAQPGSDVVVFDGTREVARARADQRGEFVALPAAPLPEGGRALTLASRSGGAAEVRGDATVMVVVPPRQEVAAPAVAVAAAPPVAVAVLVPSAAPSRVLEAPRTALSLDVVDYDDSGAIRFSGAAAPGTAVRVYVDNVAAGDARADQSGRWAMTPGAAVAPGVHSVRVDHIDPSGRVLARVELPFQRAAVAAAEVSTELASGRVVVQPGQNLWRLARSAYGNGIRYTVIYQANQDQIRNPRLIYPGQVFAVPSAAR